MHIKLNNMLKKNLISPSKSLWAVPIVLVKTGDGQINGMTQKDAYLLP